MATGQTASKTSKGKASVCVWDVSSSSGGSGGSGECRLLSKMEACLARGVCSLAFSTDDSQLVAVGMDDSSTHILWVSKC